MSSVYKILQVEDNAGDTLLLKKAVERSDLPIELHAVQSGEAAVKLLLAENTGPAQPGNKVQAVLLDLNLPGMNGAEVLEAITAEQPLDDIKVMLLTSAADTTGFDMTGIDHRIMHHFQKPRTMAGYEPICDRLMGILEG